MAAGREPVHRRGAQRGRHLRDARRLRVTKPPRASLHEACAGGLKALPSLLQFKQQLDLQPLVKLMPLGIMGTCLIAP